MRGTIGELWLQTRITTSFWYDILYVITLNNSKTTGHIYGCTTHQTTALLLKRAIFCVEAGCEIRLTSYGSKHSLQAISNKPIVPILTRITRKLQVLCGRCICLTTGLLLKTLLVWFRVACEIDWRVTGELRAPSSQWLYSDTALCA